MRHKSALMARPDLMVLSLFTAVYMMAFSVCAQTLPYKNLKISGALRTQYIFEENRDLSLENDNAVNSVTIDGFADFRLQAGKNLDLFSRLRASKTTLDNITLDPQTGETSRDDEFIELRQLWLRYKSPLGLRDTSVTIGRQRIRENYGLWWNRNLDSATLQYETDKFEAMVGAGENLRSYNSSKNDFQSDDKNRFRIFAKGSWLLPQEGRAELRALYEHDHANPKQTGDFVSPQQRDDTDFRLLWAGMRLKNQGVSLTKEKNLFFSYRADLIGQTGELSRRLYSNAPGDLKQITGSRNLDSRAWAFDGALSLSLSRAPAKPSLTFGYATGSGDSDPNDNTDRTFYMNGLNSSRSAHFGSSRAFHNYGEALRPDLSNLQVLRLAASFTPLNNADLTLVYYRYLLNEISSGLQSASIRIPENGSSRDIGQALDLTMNANLSEIFRIDHTYAQKLLFRSSVGVFKAGDAYAPGGDKELIGRGLAEIMLKL